MAEAEIKQKHKIDGLKKRFREVEGENDLLQEKLHRAQKSIKRLRLERSILLERIDKGFEHGSESDTSSDLFLHNDLTADSSKPSTNHHHHKNYKQTEKNNTATAVIKPPKKKKDPNAPKGPGNVFFVFCRQERDKVKEEFPEESIGDVTKLLGLKWKGLTKEEKLVYHDMFKREMDEYEEAMKTYKSNGAGRLPLEEDPTEELTTAESLISSPVSPNNDIIMQQQQHQQHTSRYSYHQNDRLYDQPFQNNYVADNHQSVYDSQPDFMSNNQENYLIQHHQHNHNPPIQQQPLQPTFTVDNNTAFEKPAMTNPHSAPYDHF
ncbi:hypothetical protein [Parasitella parasitica]|uniref:HMG box domain-containing protein n=1 Tax=Parasitella parasitica TaxID=35722 RepID=A0A0B7N6G8_9FUNG|nr:hypothetical protein [Parasitella parasitica]